MKPLTQLTLAPALVIAGALMASTASADLRVSFQESAPKDRFSIFNEGGCDLTNLALTIDLTPSAGGLIFDTEPTGEGVEVYQPFEIVEGMEHIQSIDTAADGGKSVTINFTRLAPNDSARFTVDVDDTLTNSALGQIRVAGGEIEGAIVSAVSASLGNPLTGSFSTDATAELSTDSCQPVS